ncbi:MAG: YraN family protein [Sphingomicrobium sp.]
MRGGEIDLIAKHGRKVAFIEVKQHATEEAAGQSLGDYRLRWVIAAARSLAPRYAANGEDVRIDAIFTVPGRPPRHLANIWHG